MGDSVMKVPPVQLSTVSSCCCIVCGVLLSGTNGSLYHRKTFFFGIPMRCLYGVVFIPVGQGRVSAVIISNTLVFQILLLRTATRCLWCFKKGHIAGGATLQWSFRALVLRPS